jgi:3-mercaptopyruvate sulfurtransferase SseA
MRHPLFSLVIISVGLAATLAIAVISSAADEVQQIKAEELKKLIESNDPNILVVDTQPKGVYDLGHIKGATNFPWATDIRSPGDLPRDKVLILYCDCAHAEDSIGVSDQLSSKSDSCSADDDSTYVAEQLMSKFGYKSIKILEGGWSKWQQLGYPVDKR